MYCHQWEAFGRLLQNDRFLYGDGPGMGKTLTTAIAAVLKVVNDRHDRVLVIAPAQVHASWIQEFNSVNKALPRGNRLPTQVVSGRSEEEPIEADSRVIITTMDTFRGSREIVERAAPDPVFGNVAFKVVVVDEAHETLANESTLAYKALQKYIRQFPSKDVVVWLLSGTFAPNEPNELRAAFRLIDEFVDTEDDFRRAQQRSMIYRRLAMVVNMQPIVRETQVVHMEQPFTALEINAQARSHNTKCISVKRHREGAAAGAAGADYSPTNVSDLVFSSASTGLTVGARLDVELAGAAGAASLATSAHRIVDVCKLRKDAAERARVVVQPAFPFSTRTGVDVVVRRRITDSDYRGAGAGASTTETRFTLYPINAEFRKRAVAQAIVDMIRSDPAPVPTLIFFHHVCLREEIERQLAAQTDRERFSYVPIHGDVSTAQRDQNRIAFQKNAEANIALLSFSVAGTGINLQRATRVIIAELPWNFAALEQAEHRAWRIGQERPVNVKYLLCDKGLDAYLFSLIMLKIRRVALGLPALPLPKELQVALQQAREHGLQLEDPDADAEAEAAAAASSQFEQRKRLREQRQGQEHQRGEPQERKRSGAAASDLEKALKPARARPDGAKARQRTRVVWLIDHAEYIRRFKEQNAQLTDETDGNYERRAEGYAKRWNDYEISRALWWDDYARTRAGRFMLARRRNDPYDHDVIDDFEAFVRAKELGGDTAGASEEDIGKEFDRLFGADVSSDEQYQRDRQTYIALKQRQNERDVQNQRKLKIEAWRQSQEGGDADDDEAASRPTTAAAATRPPPPPPPAAADVRRQTTTTAAVSRPPPPPTPPATPEERDIATRVIAQLQQQPRSSAASVSSDEVIAELRRYRSDNTRFNEKIFTEYVRMLFRRR